LQPEPPTKFKLENLAKVPKYRNFIKAAETPYAIFMQATTSCTPIIISLSATKEQAQQV